MTKVLFTVDKDYACTMFNSCKKVSLIASASLTSSIAFLDFMGYNGKNQSLSIITFNETFVNEDNDKGLKTNVYECSYQTDNPDGSIDGYPNIK